MDFIKILLWLACAVQAYLLGSISFAYVIGKLVVRRDIRKYGSGNAGASNMTRNFGWKLGLVTFIGDIAKGSGAALIGFAIAGNTGMAIGAVFAVVGHNWPVFFDFRGGKGISTTLGALFVLMPWQALICLGVAGILIITLRYVSVASLIGALLMVVAGFIFTVDLSIHIALAILFALAVFSHRENIVRLAKGTENKMTFGKGRPRKRRKEKSEDVET
jgi:glycerol-3-phosphate acyltransferase PlsY